ncbi:hypothetical protein [Halanaerobaculum tunisiense]
MSIHFTFAIYTGILALVLVTLVPRKMIRELIIYGIIFGAIGDFLAVFIVTHLLEWGGYINYGPFGFRDIPFFPLLAWAIWFIMYFYFMPDHKVLRYVYIVSAAAYSVLFSNILANFDIFRWNFSEIIIPFFIYVTWFTGSAWAKEQIDQEVG